MKSSIHIDIIDLLIACCRAARSTYSSWGSCNSGSCASSPPRSACSSSMCRCAILLPVPCHVLQACCSNHFAFTQRSVQLSTNHQYFAFVAFADQEYERCVRYILPACSRMAGRHVEQTFAILDMKGTNARTVHHACCWKGHVCDSPTALLQINDMAQQLWKVSRAHILKSALCAGVGIRHVTGGIKRMLGTVLQVITDFCCFPVHICLGFAIPFCIQRGVS